MIQYRLSRDEIDRLNNASNKVDAVVDKLTEGFDKDMLLGYGVAIVWHDKVSVFCAPTLFRWDIQARYNIAMAYGAYESMAVVFNTKGACYMETLDAFANFMDRTEEK